jgi:hypothetical protein
MIRIEIAETKRLKARCPECNDSIKGTGSLQYWTDLHQWFVEFYCPRDDQVIPISTPDLDRKARNIAKKMIGTDEPTPCAT